MAGVRDKRKISAVKNRCFNSFFKIYTDGLPIYKILNSAKYHNNVKKKRIILKELI